MFYSLYRQWHLQHRHDDQWKLRDINGSGK